MTWTTRPRSESAGLAAIVAGEGPRIVLLHGVGLCADAWGPVIDGLSSDFQVVAPDLPGHGGSPLGPRHGNLDGYADAIGQLLDEPVMLAGHSLGAMIALKLAERVPQRVRAVAALNAIFERTPAAQDAVRQRAAALDGESMADPAATLGRWFGAGNSAERQACERWLTSVDPAGYKAAYSVFANENGPNRAALAGLGMPALFMTGADDPNSTPEMSRQMARLAPKGEAAVLDSAAHMMPMTHSAEVTSALRALGERAGQ